MLACDDDSGDASSSVIEQELDPGSYQVIVKGDGASDAGPYRLSLRDLTTHPDNKVACDDDSGTGETSYLEQNLDPGVYYLRMTVRMSAETGFEEPPVMYGWDLTYLCHNVL